MTQQFGTDLWVGIQSDGSIDLDPSMREASGLYVLVQSIVMRQTSPLGSCIGALNECFDLRTLVSRGMTLAQIQLAIGAVKNQLQRDQRVKSSIVNGNYDVQRSTLTLTEQIKSGLGPFTLTIAVSKLTVQAFLNGVPLGGGS